MTEKYEQMEIDTRSDFRAAIDTITDDAVKEAWSLINKGCENSSEPIMPSFVRNRYEAYGVASEQLINITIAVKMVKKDVDSLLETLSDPGRSAVEAASSIYNSTAVAAGKMIQMAAVMKRTMDHLYTEELTVGSRPSPLEAWAADNSQDFQEAEPMEDVETENTENETEE